MITVYDIAGDGERISIFVLVDERVFVLRIYWDHVGSINLRLLVVPHLVFGQVRYHAHAHGLQHARQRHAVQGPGSERFCCAQPDQGRG